MHAIALNARFYAHQTTGVQRYAAEVVRRFGARIKPIEPVRPLKGMVGHMWEQLYLPTAVNSNLLWSPNNTGPLAIRRQVCTIHDMAALDHPEWFSAKFAAWYRWLLPRLVRRVRHVIAVSEFTKQRILALSGSDPRNITVIPNGVDARFRPASADHRLAVKQALGITGEQFLLYVGSVEPRKNLRVLLDAWNLMNVHDRDGLELVIAGARGRPAVFSNSATAPNMPGVRYLGYVSEEQLPVLYSAALALVYPSLYEGFGLPPLEAMACGTPVVTSDTTAIPEAVGDAAILVDPTNPHSIAEGLEHVIRRDSIRAELTRKGLLRVKQMTWDRTAEHTWRVLQHHID
jgi:glycosyltransferase involved in cell wall biosynthesis